MEDPKLLCDFLSDRELGKPARGRERRLPELQDGISVFKTREQAVARREAIRDHLTRRHGQRPTSLLIGDHIACVHLVTGAGFAYEDLEEPEGHMTVWGDPIKLTDAVAEITPAD